MSSQEEPTRAGFIGLAGRPNVGKSTLLNALVGAHVAIVSERAQTTRRVIRGVAQDADGRRQLVLIDLPGVQRPLDALTERMQRRVERELADADVVLLVLNAQQGVGPGDRFIDRALLGGDQKVPVVCAVNKCDLPSRAEVAAVLAQAAELGSPDELFPVSARTGTGVGALRERLFELVPAAPFPYPPASRSDQPRELAIAELIREQVLHRVRDELPHAVEVLVSELHERPGGPLVIEAELWAESPSQKAILIGRGGSMVRAIGTAARRRLERELGQDVYLQLAVKVRPRWRGDEALLDRLGIG